MRKIYLSGACKNVSKDISSTWRSYVEVALESMGIKSFNPNNHFDYKDKTPLNDKECRKLFLHYVRECDILLVNLDFSNVSCGTNYEIGYAQALNKPIIGFGSYEIYPWAADACDVVLETMADAVDYIATHYSD